MTLDRATVQTKWWFVGTVLLCALVTQRAVLRSAGVDTHPESFWSAVMFVNYLVTLGVWYLYSELGKFFVLRVWPVLSRFTPAKNHT